MKRLAIIDGKSIFYRGYYAMPNLSLPDGTPTGGVFGFASIAIELIKKLEPDYVTVAWDKPKTNIRKRRQLYPEYKANRKAAPPDFYAQIPILHELLDAFGWPLYELDDYEADDIMGAFAVEAEAKGIETCLLTSDLDALQLISSHTKVFAIKNGFSNIEEFDVEHFENKYGISVDQFLDLKSLKGDSSDNIPGVPGVGEKTAISLLQDYKTLDGIYEHIDEIKPSVAKKLLAGKEAAYLSKEIGRIWTDAPVKLDWDIADVNDTDLPRVAQILNKLEFHSLTRRLPKHMQFQSDQMPAAEELPAAMVRDWPKELFINGPVVIEIEDETLWLSLDKENVFKSSLSEVGSEVWRLLEMTTVVSYDIKTLLHTLAKYDIAVSLGAVHDIRQAAFLIDPLSRDRSIEAIAAAEITDMPAVITGLWRAYERQSEVFDSEPNLKTIATDFDFPLTKILFAMEQRGVLIDPSKLASMSEALGKKHHELEQQMYTMAGREFNIGSPAQLSEVLFTTLELPTTGIKKGKTGYSTGQSELNKLRGQHPIIELIEQTRELAKLKNTYTDALPKLADEHNRIHTTFNQDVAATGRLSSTNPNLQNIPIRTELGREIREAFIANKGNVLVSADYSQFELRLAAVLAGDQALIDDFNSGIDVHTKTASEVYGIPLKEVTKDQRRAAKVINFGVLYGMSPHGLAAAAKMSFIEAKQFIDQYFKLRSPIREYIDATLDRARKDGYVETFYGRRRPTPDVHSSNFIVRQAAERAAANMPIQGTEADLMKRAMIAVEEKLAGKGEQVLQIHDSILIECPKEHADHIAAMLEETMETIAPELAIKLKVDVSIGSNWGEL
ncbi:MAG TPA: DNA polymerase I [Candidatus Saccharibacteria bacterium]|nr:DNA polymerase I [Candidatus Saccharibacteria bacterium]